MSLHFSVSGANIRTLLNCLLCVGKIGDSVFFVALKDGIEVSAVTPTQNGHIAVRIHERCFDSFSFTPKLSSTGGDEGSEELYLCVHAKTTAATVLRQHNNSNLQSIEFEYDTAAATATPGGEGSKNATAAASAAAVDVAPQQHTAAVRGQRTTDLDEQGDADVVRWRCTYANNITKVFLLRLAEGLPTSVCADASRYHFEVCGDAFTFGSLLASLPSSMGQCGLALLESGGLELRSVSNTQQQQQQQASSSTARGKRAGVGGAVVGRGSGSIGESSLLSDGSATVVTAFAKAFHLYRFFDIVRVSPPPPAAATGAASVHVDASQAGEDVDASTGPSVVPPTPSSLSHTPQRLPGVVGTPAAAVLRAVDRPYLQLPGKVFDVKPFKQAAWLADQLGVQLRLRCGDAGTPLCFDSITLEEVTLLKAGRISTSGSGGGGFTESFRTPAPAFARPAGALPVPIAPAVPPCISFVLHVAALDTTEASAAGQGEAGVATTAHSSTVNTPRTSGHLPRHHQDQHPDTAAALELPTFLPTRAPRGGSEGHNDYIGPSPSGNSVHASATHSSMNGGDPPATFSSGQHSLSHIEASFTNRTPDAAAGDSSVHASVSNSAFTTPRPPLSAATRNHSSSVSDAVVVMTGGDTPENGRQQGNGETSFSAFPTQQGPANSYAASALNTMYPLDFAAFARTYTTSNDVEAEEEGEEGDAQDVALQDFLASCVASMSRGSTQN